MDGVRWTQESPTRAVLRWHWSWPVAHCAAMGWNGAFALGGLVATHPKAHNMVPFAGAGAIVFALFLVRSLLVRTTLGFDRGVFTVSSTWLADKTLSLAVGDIERFIARHNSTTNATEVVVLLRDGEKALPIDLEPFNMVWKGTDRQVWAGKPENAQRVAARLEEMLDHARRNARETYRA